MKERVLITVKTYPTISRTYSELVCTAGLREDGSWVRIYPVAFRQWNSKYKKYQWVEVDLVENTKDKRPESFKPTSPEAFTLLDEIGTSHNWAERKQYVLEKGNVYRDLGRLIQLNKASQLSLATFKPAKILDFVVEAVEREWDPSKLEDLKAAAKQGDLFGDTPEFFRVVNKLPYKFSYRLVDEKGKESTMMIEDWEIGALFWNCLRKHGNEEQAVADVKKQYFDNFAQSKDIYLFLGTTLKYDGWANNPFVIVGTFTPDIEKQQGLF